MSLETPPSHSEVSIADWTAAPSKSTSPASSGGFGEFPDGGRSKKGGSKATLVTLTVITGIFGIAGLLFAGAALGQYWWPNSQPTQIVLPPQSGADEEETVDAVMPDLFGLDVDSANLVLQDHGFLSVEVKTSTKPAPGEPGRILSQKPAPGTKDASISSVEVVLSEPMKMPDYAGKPLNEVTSELDTLGVYSRLKKVVTGEKTPGTVLGTTPKADEVMPDEVEILVADPGESVFVNESSTAHGKSEGCSSSSVTKAGGKKYENNIVCSLWRDKSFVALTPGKKATLISFDAAVADESRGANAYVRIIADGTVLKEFALPRGQIVPIVQPIPNTFDLTIEVTGDKNVQVVLGQIRYSADPVNIGELK